MADQRVVVSKSDGVAEVRMSRADKRNALDTAMFAALVDAGEQLKADPSVRAVVLCGDGASFCAGLDVAAFTSLETGAGGLAALTPSGLTHVAQQACWVWQELAVPVIAAVQGHALGGGLQIALGADLRIVHPEAKLSVREIHWGLIPDMTGTLMLATVVRADVAKVLTLTGRMMSGTEASHLGLVTELSDDPHRRAHELAAEIAARNPDAVRATKRLFARLYVADFRAQLAAEREEIGRIIGSPNQVEAVAANFAKRPPVFTDPS